MKKIISASLMALLCSCLAQGQQDMLGSLTKEEILQGCPDWQAEVASYNPKPEIVDQLRSLGVEVRIEIYLGTWCSDSKAHLSAFFKVLELVENPLIQVSYVGVPEEKSSRAPYYQGKNIEKLPTFLIYMDGREKGRIVETPTLSVEQDLLEIIRK